ncbi:Transmembrane protein [Salix suchowensis]|nr:Transmembrane protein [Salix suchowensis]
MTDQSSRLSIANLRTTSKLIKQTASTFSSNLFIVAFLFPYILRKWGPLPEIVRSGIQFKAAEENHSYVDNANNDEDEDSERSREDFNSKESGEEKIVDLQFLLPCFFLVSFLSAAYGWVILGFTAIYSWVLGIVFVVVFIGVVWDGSRLGSKRLAGFILMRWADQYSFFKLFVWLKLMPFSIMLPWINGFETEISGILIIWMLLDLVVGRTGREILKEGCYLISTMFNQAVQIKCYEEILCGSAARWVFAQVFGKILATLLHSAFEVYFMVAWLIFYFVARCKDADSDGRRFGRRELKGLIDGLR